MTFNGRDFEDWHRSGWDPTYRLADQDRDGVVAEMLFATVGMPLCGHPDLDYRHACMVAYNRWLQEFCAHAPTRLYGAGQAAIKNADEGVRELTEIKAMGFKSVMMSGVPGENDYDDPRTTGCGPRRWRWSCHSVSTFSPTRRTAVTEDRRSTRCSMSYVPARTSSAC